MTHIYDCSKYDGNIVFDYLFVIPSDRSNMRDFINLSGYVLSFLLIMDILVRYDFVII